MSRDLSERLQSTARALEDSDLTSLSGVLSADAVVDVLEHAAVLAAEAEAEAARAGNLTPGVACQIAYAPLVRLLGTALLDQAAT